MISSQDLAIYNIIKLKRVKYIKASLVPYFSDIPFYVYEVLYELGWRKVPITEEVVKNLINRYPWKDTIKFAAIDYVHNLCRQELVSSDIDIPYMLKNEYFEKVYARLKTLLADRSKFNHEIINAEILKIAEIIKKSQEASDMATYDEVIHAMSEAHKNGIPSELQKQNIYLEDENLITIFGKVLAPEPYTIIGRPGDGKSTLMIDLIVHLKSLKKRGILISLEDNKSIASLKIFAMESRMDFEKLKNQNYNTSQFDSNLGEKDKMVIILDKLRNSKQIADDVKNLTDIMDIDYIAVDYIQRIKSSHGEIYKKMSEISDMLLEMNKELNLPIIQLSQVDKTSAQSLGLLGMGSAKGAGEIDANTRWGGSVNPSDSVPDPDTGYFRKTLSIFKSVNGQKTLNLDFCGKSRKLMAVTDASC